MKYRALISILLILLFIHNGTAQNRLNKNKQRTGRWVVYTDSTKTKKLFEGRFRNGEAVGTSHYYSLAGTLDRKETKRFKKLHTAIFYPDGKKFQQGKARIVNDSLKIRYFFYGRWKNYDSTGKLVKYIYYEEGHVTKTVYLDRSIATKDSLIFALNEIEKNFSEKNKEILDSISASRWNAARRERLQRELYFTDTLNFKRIENIINLYGYPSKKLVDEAVYIPFFILSHAPAAVKESFLPVLESAANKDDISWKTLAFFIDKLRLEKSEKQLYGTQGFLKQLEWVLFPCEDPERLAERRRSVGLE